MSLEEYGSDSLGDSPSPPKKEKKKEYKVAGIGGAKAAQVRAARNKSAESTKDEEWMPLKPVVIDMDSKFKIRYTQAENYRAYKLFNIIDTTNGGSISERELKRCLMGDTFQVFKKSFDHADCGFVYGLDEDKCVMVDAIEPHSPASHDPYLLRGLQIWRVNGTHIPPNDPKSLPLVYKLLMTTPPDHPVEFEMVEPILQITQFSNYIDVVVDGVIYSVELPVGAVYNLDEFRKKLSRAFRRCEPKLGAIKIHFDGKRRQAHLHCEEFEFGLMFASGPNYHRSSRYALGFASEDSPPAYDHRGQPMVFDLDLGVKQKEADVVLTELFAKFDEDGSGEFEYEEFRDFYIRFLDTDESIDLLRRYAMYRFRDLEKESAYYEAIRLRKYKKERRADLAERERPLRKKQSAFYKENSMFDVFGIRRRVYKYKIPNLTMDKPKGAVRRKERSQRMLRAAEEEARRGAEREQGGALLIKNGGVGDGSSPGTGAGKRKEKEIAHGEAGDDDGSVQTGAGGGSGNDESTVGSASAGGFVRLTTEERLLQRREIKAKRKKHDMARRLKMNEIFAQNAQIARQNRKDALQMAGTLASIHMQDMHAALKLARKTAVRTEDSGVAGITKFNVSFTHVIATPALIITPTMFTDNVNNDDIELENLSSSQMHPAVQRYFLIRQPKGVNSEFDSYNLHPSFFTADYEREPSRHSSFGMGVCSLIDRQLQEGIEYRKKHKIPKGFDKVPEWDAKPQAPAKVSWRKKDPPLKSDRLVCRATVWTVRVSELPTVTPAAVVGSGLAPVLATLLPTPLVANSPSVSIRVGDQETLCYKFATEIVSLAGSTCQWDDLGWVLRIRARDSIEVVVMSGTPSKQVVIGKATISALELADKPVDAAGMLEMSLTLYGGTKGTATRGSVYFKVFMEQGGEWDWFRVDYMRKQAELQKQAKFHKWLLRQKNAPKTILPFPLHFTVQGIRAFDLQPVHLLISNSPYITLEYGDADNKQTTVMEGAGYQAEWRDLGWAVRCSTRRNNMIFMAYSGYTVIGE